MRPGNALWQTSPARLLCLTATVFTILASTSQADEYRLYRIVGSELELYRRLEFEPDTNRFVPYVDETTQLRDAGFFDIKPEDMAEESRRPQTRGDGFLWDAPRSRWIGFDGESSATLVAFSQDNVERTLVTLHEFEPAREGFAFLSPTNDPSIYFATFSDWDLRGLPMIARIVFGEDSVAPSVEMWDMSDRDPKLMREIYGTPFPNDDYFDSAWSTVSTSGHVLTLANYISEWEFGVMPPMHSTIRADGSYPQFAVSPEEDLVAAVDTNDGCTLNVWRTTEETPFLSVPLQETDWLSGGIVAFTPDGEYLWYDSIFSDDLRVWRCADWVELDAYQIEDKSDPTFSSFNTAEWVVLHRDAPFEEEPTEWLKRGPYVPDEPDDSWGDNGEPGFTVENIVRVVVLGVLTDLLSEPDEHRESRAERRRHRRHLPRRPEWDED